MVIVLFIFSFVVFGLIFLLGVNFNVFIVIFNFYLLDIVLSESVFGVFLGIVLLLLLLMIIVVCFSFVLVKVVIIYVVFVIVVLLLMLLLLIRWMVDLGGFLIIGSG